MPYSIQIVRDELAARVSQYIPCQYIVHRRHIADAILATGASTVSELTAVISEALPVSLAKEAAELLVAGKLDQADVFGLVWSGRGAEA